MVGERDGSPVEQLLARGDGCRMTAGGRKGHNTKTIDTAMVSEREATTAGRRILGSLSTPIVPLESR
jgi:hypothetical protein